MPITTEQRPGQEASKPAPLRVMLIADSEVVGARVAAAIEQHDDIAIMVRVHDGVAAVSALRNQVVDAIVLDMGDARGNVKVTLSRLFKVDPQAKIVMVASLSFANVKTSMQGLMEGAAEFIATPAAHTKSTSEIAFARELATVLRAFGRSERTLEQRTATARVALAGGQLSPLAPPPKPITLRPAAKAVPRVIAVGSSTGGPQALFTFIATLPPEIGVPILITQHMPATFTALLAGHISKNNGRDCREGKDGEPVVADRIYLAPGDHHMMVVSTGGGAKIRLTDDPPINFCRPSVEPMFESIANIYKAEILAVMLTGMGSDGLQGSRRIVEAGGTVIAQDQETSVVWGMPRAVAEAGLCSAVLPLDDLGSYVAERLKG